MFIPGEVPHQLLLLSLRYPPKHDQKYPLSPPCLPRRVLEREVQLSYALRPFHHKVALSLTEVNRPWYTVAWVRTLAPLKKSKMVFTISMNGVTSGTICILRHHFSLSQHTCHTTQVSLEHSKLRDLTTFLVWMTARSTLYAMVWWQAFTGRLCLTFVGITKTTLWKMQS